MIGSDPDYVGRSRRLVGLLVDRGFGLVPWAPGYVALVPALAWMARRRPTGWVPLVGVVVAAWVSATWIALTMHGWWWPGRQLVVGLTRRGRGDRRARRSVPGPGSSWRYFGGIVGAATWIWLAGRGLHRPASADRRLRADRSPRIPPRASPLPRPSRLVGRHGAAHRRVGRGALGPRGRPVPRSRRYARSRRGPSRERIGGAAMSRLVVVGAGPAGLLAALDAARAGHDCIVHEAAPAVGGMSASFTVAGIRVDHGSHRLHPATAPELLGLLHRMLGDELQLRPRNGRIRLRDRWVAFPLRPGDLVRNLPPRFALGVARDLLGGPLRRGGPTFVDQLRRRLGPTVTDDFYVPYARKLYGVDPGLLDAELANRRVSAPSTVAVARRALRRSGSPGRVFWYPALGVRGHRRAARRGGRRRRREDRDRQRGESHRANERWGAGACRRWRRRRRPRPVDRPPSRRSPGLSTRSPSR